MECCGNPRLSFSELSILHLLHRLAKLFECRLDRWGRRAVRLTAKIGRMRTLPLHFMILPGLVLVLIYCYSPMFGIVMAFERYVPTRGITGSEWIGLDNYRYLLDMPDSIYVLRNTIIISFMKIVAGLFVPIIVALLLNEVRKESFIESVWWRRNMA